MDSQKPPRDPRAFPCPYEGCLQAFPSEGQLIKHKKFTASHEYCERCNEDFQDEDDLLIHKMTSSKHIVCPRCFDEFKSEGGRDAHIRQFHREAQKLECDWCQLKFSRAAALMEHIERGQCEKISLDKYRMRRVEKKAIKEAMNNHLLAPTPSSMLSSTASSVDGGVGIDNLLDDDDCDQSTTIEARKSSILEKINMLSLEHDGVETMTLPDALTEAESSRSIKQWPVLKDDDIDDENNRPGRMDQHLEDLMAFSDGAPTVGATSPKAFAPSEYDSGSGWDTAAMMPASSLTNMENMEMTKKIPDGELKKFFSDIHGTYICPCDISFKTKDELEKHIASGVHAAGVMRCSRCLRLFKSAAALVAHTESATKRCRISQTMNFNQVIDEISGGVIGVAGRNDDGTIRFEAAPGVKEIEW